MNWIHVPLLSIKNRLKLNFLPVVHALKDTKSRLQRNAIISGAIKTLNLLKCSGLNIKIVSQQLAEIVEEKIKTRRIKTDT